MSDVSTWSPTDGSNTDPLKSGQPEGMKRSDVNDRSREVMGAVRRWYADPEFLDLARDSAGDPLAISKVSDTVVRIGGEDFTAQANTGRRLRLSVGGGAATYCHIVSSAFGTDTDITCESFSGAGTVVPNGCDTLDFHFGPTLGKLAFVDTQGFGFYLPPSFDSEGIQVAIDAADANGGGIVLLGENSYAIDATLVVGSGVVLFGAGPGASMLVCDAALASVAINMGQRAALIGFTLDQTAQAAGAYDGIRVGNNIPEVQMDRLRIEGAPRYGIWIATQGHSEINLSNIWIDNPKQSGIVIEDATDASDRIVLSNITVVDPGADGTTVDVAGVKVQGRCSMSNIVAKLERGSPTKARGVWFDTKNAGGLNRAYLSALNGFKISGAGDLAIGIEFSGERCSAAGGTISLPGTTSRGVLFDSQGAGQVADFNHLSDAIIEGCDLGVFFTPDAHDNLMSDCLVRTAQTSAVQDSGTRNHISGGTLNGASSGPVVEITASAVDSLVSGSRIIRAGTGTGVRALAGATRCQAIRCDFLNCGTNVDLEVSAADGCAAYDCSPSPRSHVLALMTSEVVQASTSDATVYPLAPLEGVRLPGPAPDGVRTWRVRGMIQLVWTGGSGRTADWELRLGSTGDATDPIIVGDAGRIAQPIGTDPRGTQFFIPGGEYSNTGGLVSRAATYLPDPTLRDLDPSIWRIMDTAAATYLQTDWLSTTVGPRHVEGFRIQPAAGESFVTLSINVVSAFGDGFKFLDGSYLELEYVDVNEVN